MKLAQIATTLGARLENGSPDLEISGVAGIHEAGPGQLTFVANPKMRGEARTTKASAVIVSMSFPSFPPPSCGARIPISPSREPSSFFGNRHDTSRRASDGSVAPSATVGEGAHVGPYVVVDQDVEIGRNAMLLAHVVIYRGATLAMTSSPMRTQWCGKGVGSAIMFSCRMVSSLALMALASPRTIPGTGTRSCNRNRWSSRTTSRFRPTLAWIGPAWTRPILVAAPRSIIWCRSATDHALGNTLFWLRKWGWRASTEVGDHVILTGQVGVVGHCTVGDGAVVTPQSGVAGDIEAGAIVSGAPAVDHKLWLKYSAVLPRLPEIARAVRAKAPKE